MSYLSHIRSAEDLVTTSEEVRAGFLKLALEKNNQATPYIEEAKVLKSIASKATDPEDLLTMTDIQSAILTASGISDKALGYFKQIDKENAIQNLISEFLKPAGTQFIDELVYRFLIIRGDSVGGKMRNLGGVLAQYQLIRTIIATLSIQGKPFKWLNSDTQSWIKGDKNNPDIPRYARGLYWPKEKNGRTLIFNIKVPIVDKNVDLCLLNGSYKLYGKNAESIHHQSDRYIAVGELKGGIDPAGADEHWKTANTALGRIKDAFVSHGPHVPQTFFIAAAIAKAMAEEIYSQLQNGQMMNAANLTNEFQLCSLCDWLVSL